MADRMTAAEFQKRMADGGWSDRVLADSLNPRVSLGAITRWRSGDRGCPAWLSLAMDSVERRVPRERRRKRQPPQRKE